MSETTYARLFWILVGVSVLTAGLLYLGPEDLLGDTETTEYVLKTMLYPTVLGFLVLSWKKIDKRIKNDKPEERGE